MKNTLLAIIFGLLSYSTFAQELEYDNKNYIDNIATVLLTKNIDIYDPMPIIRLNSNETLKLSFDQLQGQNEFFNYTYVHCDANWQPSEMMQSEYLQGNPMGEITNFTYSTNTYQQYVHYRLTFPTQNMKITRSGNYLLKVFKNFNEEELVLTRRFMVLDEQTSVSADVKPATSPEYRFTKQEVDFTVDYKDFNIPNPFMDVNVTILQNNSWTTAIYNLKPQFVNSNKLTFNYEEENLFDGAHEFRFFDIRTLRAFSNQVVDKYMDTVMNVVLRPDETRSHQAYLRWIDYNGKRVVENKDGVNIVEDGDYAMVHFTLDTRDKSKLGDIYIYGGLSDWQCKEEFKMHYDSATGMYKASVLLKQSYYNYHYVLKDKEGNIDYSFTEGSHYETENDYTILVYHRNVYYGYDELIGIATRNSLAEANR
ncbi:DUF5103 domain-containing protein [bacterium]|nr:DUF5103 domain-containing protein [bacterium]